MKFAEMFKEEYKTVPVDECETIQRLIFGTAKIFHYDNSAFRPYQFFIACGIEKTAAAYMEARI